MKTVLITGASGGIGQGAAKAFAAAGYQVALQYHTKKDIAVALAKDLQSQGVCAMALQADLRDEEQAARMVQQVTQTLGHIDVLINNAGIACQKLLTDMTGAEWRELFETNVNSAFYCTKEVLPQMISRQDGLIINVSSIWGMVGASCEVAYSASKAALIGFTKALAKEVGPSNIRVNCVAPGVIATRMNAALTEEDMAALKEETPLGCIGTPEDVAQSLLFLASPGGRFITGQVISPNGGLII